MKIDQSEIYKKMVEGVVTIFPLIEEDVGMMLDGLLQDTARVIVDLDPWVSVEERLPGADVNWVLLEVVDVIYGILEYKAVQLFRVSLDVCLDWDDLILLRWQPITPPKGA